MVEIYVELLNEGVAVWRPVQAVAEGEDAYRIVGPTPPPEGETWRFPLGAVVRCQWRTFQDGKTVLVAQENTG
jgi:hypothetical protein